MRYFLLVLLNMPIILLAFINIITQYKTKKVELKRFRFQIIAWSTILVLLIASFPAYNLLAGKPILDSRELSLFDIVQTTVIIYLIYVVNNHRRKIEQTERTLRDLHQEISIILSKR